MTLASSYKVGVLVWVGGNMNYVMHLARDLVHMAYGHMVQKDYHRRVHAACVFYVPHQRAVS